MGEESGFFRVLGRINAVLFTLTVSVVLLIALVAGYTMFAGTRQAYRETAAQNPQTDETLEFGGTLSAIEDPYTTLDGTGEAMLVLHTDVQNPYRTFSSGRASTETDVNVLVLDLASGRSHWMFRGTKRCIGEFATVRAKSPDTVPQGAPNPVTAVLLGVAGRDSNGDGNAVCRDDQSLYLYRPGGGVAKLLLAAKSISAIHQTADDRVLVNYYDSRTLHVRIYSTPDFRTVSDEIIASTPPS